MPGDMWAHRASALGQGVAGRRGGAPWRCGVGGDEVTVRLGANRALLGVEGTKSPGGERAVFWRLSWGSCSVTEG